MIASGYLIFIGGMKQSRPAAKRYLIIHIFSGAFLLAGIAGTIVDSGIATFPSFQLLFAMPQSVAEWSAWLMLIGVMVNLAALPFSAWLPDSYSAASPFGMVPLSAFTTKSALFVLMELFVGSTPLIALGLAMLLYGVMMALLNNHIRRHLCYTLIAQMGMMVMAVGIGNGAAMVGVAALAFCHIGYNGLLMTAAASIIRATGKHYLNDLGGLWRQMPVTSGAILLGAISMAALPFTGTYIGKHLIAEGLAATDHPFLYFLFVAGSSIAVYALFPWFALSRKSKFPNVKEVKIEIQIAYILYAALTLTAAINPELLSVLVSGSARIISVHWLSVWKQFLLITSALGAFFLLLPMLKRHKSVVLDIDYLYRVALTYLCTLVNHLCILLAIECLVFFKRLGVIIGQYMVRFVGFYSKQTLSGIAATAANILMIFSVMLIVELLP
jgi:multicomponent Na+:H+ antiporter subunit D